MSMRKVLKRILPAALLLAAAPLLQADDHPNNDRGFSADKAFQVGDIDNVNLFNGNLVLTIPIGGSYPAGGGLSYGLTLVYNSNVWDFQERYDGNLDLTYTQALPRRTSNAGLGWTVSLGRLVNRTAVGNDIGLLTYHGADGAEHVFYPTLHAGDADEPGDSTLDPTVAYTRDGSYLRFRKISASDRVVEFPDGQVHHFDATGLITRIEDRFGNYLNVTYGFQVWSLTDSQNRTQEIHFKTLTQDQQSFEVVDYVKLTAFDPTNSFATATYTFTYTSMTVARPCPANDPQQSAMAQVQQLASVLLPDGSSYQMTDYVSDVSVSDPGCRSSGAIRSLTLPTLGGLAWTWQRYVFPTQSGRLYRQASSGVATRKKTGAGGEDLGTWIYGTSLGSPVGGSQPPLYAELTNTVTDPLGHQTVHYFSVYPSTGTTTGWSRNDYSLPFTRNATDGAGRFLSSQTFASGSPTPLRSTYVLYEQDQTPALQISNDEFQDALNINRRQRSTRTVYHDDGDRYADSDASNFDGLGHYRTEATGGNFGSGNVRSATTSFNSARGTYAIDPATNQPATGHTFSMLPSTSPWLLEAFTSRQVTEGGFTDTSIYCFDATTGFLLRKRQLKNSGTAESANDTLAVYTPNGGNIQTEQYFGGDNQSLTANNTTCSMALPANAIQIDHTYQSGVRATSQYTGMPFKSLDQTIEPRTGLVWKSRDTAGLETKYDYDPMGRLTWAMPSVGHGAWTEYVYDRALSAASLAKVTVKRRMNGSQTGTVRTQNQILFDSLGRVWQEKQFLPSGSWSTRETLYDIAGNKASVSEVQTGTPTQKTQFQSYDPFGRAKTIVPPDGAAHKLTLNYYGVRVAERTVNVGTTYSAGVVTESAATTTEVYDRQGRLWKVTEPSGASNSDVTTTYSYDVGNRLKQVSTTATVNGSSVTQNRFFTYDNRGFLSSETHPEKGAAGNGTVNYSDYDARGHAGRKIDGANDLAFTYDKAERLIQVKETGTSGRILKTFTYGPDNGAGDWRLGKIQKASRNNYLTLNGVARTVRVDETYTYGGRDGRVSQRDTSAFNEVNANLGSFTQGFTYNDLGLVNTLDYPRCTHAACTQLPAPVFTDVPAGHDYRFDIEAIYPNITSGCTTTTPPAYCPDSPITRGQMAVFLIRAKMGPAFVPPPCQGLYADMPCSQNSPYVTWAEEMFRQGITAGCETNPVRKYCPDQNVTNAQMAVFVLQTMGVGAGTAAGTTCTVRPYPDVPCDYWAVLFITEESRRKIAIGCDTGFCPEVNVTRKEMARLMVRAFDIPLALDPNTQRTVQFDYSQGLLYTVTSGGTTYSTLSYHPNLMVSQVVRNNGITDTQANDPNGMRRPAAIAASGPTYQASWSSGTYGYDGAGNIKTLGTSWFTYDKVNRLVSASINDGPTGLGTQKQQTYTFDPFGNLTNIAGSNGRTTPTAAQTNRLNGTGTAYDAAGNLTNWNLAVYEYDRFNQMIKMTSGSEQAAYFYTADDERIWSYDLYRNVSHWTLRDLGGKVLRDYQDNGRWTLFTDYLYRDGLLLAAETQTGQRHFHLDHLGTPRLITRASGFQAAYHAYFPFGEEATAIAQDAERMKFTGHERDLANPAAPGDDLDYMHARHESPVTGRFLRVDPALNPERSINKPQKWNRYVYVLGNPLKFYDPSGEEENLVGGGTIVNSSSQDIYIAFDATATSSGTSNKDMVISLHPGESSETFTFDADAVVVGPNQQISGAKDGAFKISSGSVEVKDGKKKDQLVLVTDPVYRMMKNRSDPNDRSGFQSGDKMPNQWKITKSPEDMEKQRKEASATLTKRMWILMKKAFGG